MPPRIEKTPVKKLHPTVLRTALAIAGGDRTRIEVVTPTHAAVVKSR